MFALCAQVPQERREAHVRAEQSGEQQLARQCEDDDRTVLVLERAACAIVRVVLARRMRMLGHNVWMVQWLAFVFASFFRKSANRSMW